MITSTTTSGGNAPSAAPAPTGKWVTLSVIVLAQLMVVLDTTVVNIALPTAQRDLGFSNFGRQWVITGYALAFGSLLVLGGRLSDFFGRKRMFLIGVIGFAAVSALGGAAPNIEILILARVLQGALGAVVAPAALSILTTTFTEPGERGRAFGIYGAVSAAGGAVGLLLGGVLTEYTSWRWCLYVNLFIAAFAVVGATTKLDAGPPTTRPRLDLPGTLTAVAGLVGVVYGLGNAESDGWLNGLTLGPVVVGIVLLVLFVVIEKRSAHPLLPLRVIADRNRGGALLAVVIIGIGMFGVFLFLTYYLTNALGFSPVQTGAAFLPMVGLIAVAAITSGAVLLPRVGPRPLIPTGAVIAAAGMVLLTRLQLDSSYAADVLPGLLVIGIGIGIAFGPVQNTATSAIRPEDAGVGSAMTNTAQQIGGSIGTALLSSLFATAISNYADDHRPAGTSKAALASFSADSSLYGYHLVFWCSAAMFLVGAVVGALVLRSGPNRTSADEVEDAAVTAADQKAVTSDR